MAACHAGRNGVRTRRSWIVVLAASVIAGLAVAPTRAHDEECTPPPPDMVLRPGQELRLGRTAFDLAAKLRGPGATAEPDRGAGLELDLLARWAHSNGRSFRGSYVPHLDVGYVLSGPDGFEVSGKLQFRPSPRGPSYGTTLRLEDPSIRDLTLALTIRERADAVRVFSDEQACPGFPLHLVYAVDDPEPADGTVAGVGSGSQNSLRTVVVGTLDPLPLEPSPYNDIWGYDDGSTQLAIMGSNDGTFFIDVTDPGNPVVAGFIEGPSSGWRDMKTYMHYAYIVTEGGGGMQIVDLSEPLDPVLVGTYDQTLQTAHNIYIDTAIGQAWVVGANSGTRILDLSRDPEHPVEVGFMTSPYVHDAFVANNLAYLSEMNIGMHEIADSSDPANLQTLSVVPTPMTITHNSWTNDDATIMVTTDERAPGGHVAVYDIADKTAPVLLSEYQPSTTTLVHNVKFDDDDDELIAMSHYALGFKLVDLHVPTIPIEIASYDTHPFDDEIDPFNGAWGIYAFDPRGYFYVSDRQTGLYVLEYDPTGGVLSGQVRDATSGLPVLGAEVLVLSDGLVESTDADGMFGVYVEAGEILVRVKAVGYETRFLTAGEMLLGGRLDLAVELQSLPGVPLSGTVRRSTDSSGVEGVSVAIVGTQLVTTTNGDGSYEFPEVAIGQQTVTADAFGFSPEEGRIMLGENRPGSLDLVLEPARFADDAETDLGWFVSSAASSGRWERVDPNGTGGGTVQPEDDHTPDPGVTAFITGQSAPDADVHDNDVEGGNTNLTSPSIDLTGLGVARLRYHRWVSNAAGLVQIGTFRSRLLTPGSSITLETVGSEANDWIRSEIDLGSFAPLTDAVRVRFVAEPGPMNPPFQVLECGVDDIDIVRACRSRFSPELSDIDGDGTVDACDDCPLDVANDADGDGVCGDVDNTPFTNSPDQTDSDADGVGDAADNCDAVANPDQLDLDADGLGNACDPDLDGDGLLNDADPDRDDDGVPNGVDVCPNVPDAAQQDDDEDLEGNACDDDDGTVQGLRLHAGNRISWQPEVGSDGYNLYRGDVGPEQLLLFAGCRAGALPTTYHIDTDLPIPGEAYFYLVSRTVGGTEGSLGLKSSGAERKIAASCP